MTTINNYKTSKNYTVATFVQLSLKKECEKKISIKKNLDISIKKKISISTCNPKKNKHFNKYIQSKKNFAHKNDS
jgi:hypothetical protein